MQKSMSNIRALKITAEIVERPKGLPLRTGETRHLSPIEIEAIEQLRRVVSKIACGFCPSHKVADASR